MATIPAASFESEPAPQRRIGRAARLHRVTIATAGHQPHFGDWALAAEACRVMAAPAQWQRSQLIAWVLMPDHWHGLVAVGGFDDLGACIRRLKLRSERVLSARHPDLAGLWACDFDAARVDDELVAARRLVMTPVRAGLVQRIGDYPFWDARWLNDRSDAASSPGTVATTSQLLNGVLPYSGVKLELSPASSKRRRSSSGSG